jgi:iron-sulfur cluster repair protein YtfE (RIC family)
MQVTEAIALEHASLLRVFGQVERVLPRLRSAAEVATLATIVEGLLNTHRELEINFAFVALDHSLHHKKRLTTLYEDHQELDERLRQVHEAPTCARAGGLLKAGLGAARAHFHEEERDLFPMLEQALGLGVLAALGEAFQKAARAEVSGARARAPGSLVSSRSRVRKIAPL